MRILAAIGLLLWAAFGWGQARSARPTLVLIHPKDVGANIPASMEQHPLWLKWPKLVGDGSNRLLSLASRPSATDYGYGWGLVNFMPKFVAAGDGLRAVGADALLRAGAIDEWSFTVMRRPNGSVPAEAALLGLDLDGRVKGTVSFLNKSGYNFVYVASGWDEIAQMRASGLRPMMVMEYPPADGGDFSRVWLFDLAWDQVPGTGLTGVLGTERVGIVLMSTPLYMHVGWATGRPYEWIAAGPTFPIYRAVLAGLILALTAIASVAVVREKRMLWLDQVAPFALLMPAAYILGGNIAANAGIAIMPYVIAVASMALTAIAAGWHALASRRDPKSSSLAAVAATGFFACLISQPEWSVFSSTFGGLGLAPDTGLAPLVGYFALLALVSGERPGGWSRLALWTAIGLAIFGAVLPLSYYFTWWRLALWIPFVPAIFLAAIAVSHDTRGMPTFIACCVFGASLIPWFTAPPILRFDRLILGRSDEAARNFAEIIDFATSPFTLACAALAATLLFLGGRFLLHQFRALCQARPGWSGLGVCLAIVWAFAIAYPLHLTAALAVSVGLVAAAAMEAQRVL